MARSHKRSHKRSTKRNSTKKHSYKKRSYKKSPKKHSKGRRSKSTKRSSKKRSARKQRVKSHYRMRGMGTMLNMFSGAAGELEADYQAKRQAFLDAEKVYKAEKDTKNREKWRQRMESAKVSMNQAKEKMGALLKGVGEAATRAAKSLSDSAKTLGSKLSSGLKSLGSRLSSGIKSLSSSLKSTYDKFKKGHDDGKRTKEQSKEQSKNLAQWQELNKKYETSSVPSSETSSVASSEPSSDTSSV
jgi:hypothetical protein